MTYQLEPGISLFLFTERALWVYTLIEIAAHLEDCWNTTALYIDPSGNRITCYKEVHSTEFLNLLDRDPH